MAYTATNWVEGVTTLGPTNMNKIETELVFLDTRIPPAAVNYGTTLPGSPVDGQEAILVDSTTAPTYQWRFRYNNGSSSSYKWEFIGGSPYTTYLATQENIGTLSTWQDLTTVGPRLLVPRAGDYFAIGHVQGQGAATSTLLQIDLWAGTSAAVNVPEATVSASPGDYKTIAVQGRANAVGAGSDVRLRYWGNAAGGFANRGLTVWPVRV